jgi:hypothetical protein
MWLHVTLCDSVWLWITLHDSPWLYMTTLDSMQFRVPLRYSGWVYVTLHGFAWLRMTLSDSAWLCINSILCTVYCEVRSWEVAPLIRQWVIPIGSQSAPQQTPKGLMPFKIFVWQPVTSICTDIYASVCPSDHLSFHPPPLLMLLNGRTWWVALWGFHKALALLELKPLHHSSKTLFTWNIKIKVLITAFCILFCLITLAPFQISSERASRYQWLNIYYNFVSCLLTC